MPYYKQDKITLYCDDCLLVLPTLSNNSVDLIATDPPYGISFMGKDWDTFNVSYSPQGAYENDKGFKKLPRLPKMLGQLATGERIQGHFAYGGSHSRGYKDNKGMAEFFIPIWQECLRVLKPGAFAFIMCSPRQDVLSRQIVNLQEAGFNTGFTSIYWTYAEGFPKAKNMKDGSYGGFQPKPAVEVIIVAMKPLSEKSYIEQAIKNGKGITWLDDGRIPYTSENDRQSAIPQGKITIRSKGIFSNTTNDKQIDKEQWVKEKLIGRFPANLLVSDDVLNDGRKTKSGNWNRTDGQRPFNNDGRDTGYKEWQQVDDYGSFSRYFDLDKWWAKTFPFFIVSKPSKSEKHKYCDNLPEKPMSEVFKNGGADFGSIPLKGSPPPKYHNTHPTVKPIKLMTYLVTIGSRPNDAVLDPFIGSGTTAIACQLINRQCIGIDNNFDYCAIAVERLKQSVMPLE